MASGIPGLGGGMFKVRGERLLHLILAFVGV